MNSFSRRAILLTGVALLLAVATPNSGQLLPLDIVMQEKLDRTQRLLEAVVLQRHVTVEHYADELRRLSDASTWTSLESDDYLLHALDFQDAADELTAEARIGDNEGVAAAFSELVFGCVNCHTYLIGRDMAANAEVRAGATPGS